MSFKVNSTVHSGYIRVGATGECSLPNIYQFIDEIKRLAIDAGRDRILIDIQKVEGMPTGADLFFAGERIAEVFGGRLKTAVLNRPERINKLGEMTAVNRGARVIVVADETDALAWLLEGSRNESARVFVSENS